MEHEPKRRILVVEPFRLMNRYLNEFFTAQPDLTVCGQIYQGDEVLPAVQRTDPHLVLMDVTLRSTRNGIELGKTIMTTHPDVRVLILTLVDNPSLLEEARTGGLHGYILKDLTASELLNHVRTVLGGGTFFDPRIGVFCD